MTKTDCLIIGIKFLHLNDITEAHNSDYILLDNSLGVLINKASTFIVYICLYIAWGMEPFSRIKVGLRNPLRPANTFWFHFTITKPIIL